MPRLHTNNRTAGVIVVVLLMLFLVYQLVLSVRNGLALLYAMPATALMDQWQDAEEEREDMNEVFIPDTAEWQAVSHNLERARELAPNDPDYHAESGRLSQFRLQDESLEIEEIEALNAELLAHYQQAAYFRPTWPYYWWDIALAEYDSYHTYTDTYHEALQNLTRFGPWDSDAQYFLAEVSLETWESLDAATQQVALENIERALQRQPNETSELIEEYDAWDMLCSGIAAHELVPSRAHSNISENCSLYGGSEAGRKSHGTND